MKSGFTRGKVNNTLFINYRNDNLLLVHIYIDIIFGPTNLFLCDEFSTLMQKEFQINMMGELSHFLGLQIKQTKDEIFINQRKDISDMLKKYGTESVKPTATAMSTTTKLNKDDKSKEVGKKLYKSMIGSLLYLTAGIPEIMFSVCLCARLQSRLTRIFWYLIRTANVGLCYSKNDGFDLIG